MIIFFHMDILLLQFFVKFLYIIVSSTRNEKKTLKENFQNQH